MPIHPILLSVLLSFVFHVHAPSQGRLFGRVLDENGNPVPAATVYVNNAQTNLAALTNAQGYYVFLGIADGSYTVKVFKSGFPKINRNSVVVSANSTSRHDFKFGDNADIATIAEKVRPKKPAPPKSAVKKVDKPVITVKNESGEIEELDESEAEEIRLAEESAKAEEEALVTAAEKEVALTGGIASIQKAIVYPQTAINLKIEGKVVVRVFVGRDGEPLRMNIIKSAHELLDEEALRVLSENAKFSPSVVNGQTAIGVITVPITFKLGKVVW